MKQVKVDNRKAAKEVLSALPREGPTPERVIGADRVARSDMRVDRYGQVRVSRELPETLMRMRAKGSLDDGSLRAAGWLIAVHDAAFGSVMRGVTYEERVAGGASGGADYGSVARVTAQENWAWVEGLLIPEVWAVVRGVCINGATLTGTDGFVSHYSDSKARRQITGAFLRAGLANLARGLGLTVTPNASHKAANPENP